METLWETATAAVGPTNHDINTTQEPTQKWQKEPFFRAKLDVVIRAFSPSHSRKATALCQSALITTHLFKGPVPSVAPSKLERTYASHKAVGVPCPFSNFKACIVIARETIKGGIVPTNRPIAIGDDECWGNCQYGQKHKKHELSFRHQMTFSKRSSLNKLRVR